MFDGLSFEDGRLVALLKKAILVLLVGLLVIGLVSSHRAYFQVRSLELHTERTLHSGSTIQTTVVSSGRTFVDVQLEVTQGAHSEMLAMLHLPKNKYAFFDWRTQRGEQTVTLTREFLAQFQSGAAQVRATALGRAQWTRVPPPVAREMTVEIERE